jgi:hypothetical protein
MTPEAAIARAGAWNAWIARDAQAWRCHEQHHDGARYVNERGPMPPILATTSNFAALSSP